MSLSTVHLYALCWNDLHNLPWFFRHYDTWVDRYLFFDDGSTDGSVEYLRRHPKVEVRRFDRVHPDSVVDSARVLYEAVWHESRGEADWVVITNIDEHVHHHRGMPAYLEECAAGDVTVVPAVGYQMIAPSFPDAGSAGDPVDDAAARPLLHDVVRDGVRWQLMNKLALFDPDAVEQTGYLPGRHRARPTGQLVFPERDELRLLHFKYLGLEYVTTRNEELRRGLRIRDVVNGWGHQYLWRQSEIAQNFEQFRLAAEPVDLTAPPSEAEVRRTRLWWRGDA